MYKHIRKNKRKMWRKTYGKVFARRNAVLIAQMAVVAAVNSANTRLLISSFPHALLCVAEQAISTAQSLAAISKQMRSGRVTK